MTEKICRWTRRGCNPPSTHATSSAPFWEMPCFVSWLHLSAKHMSCSAEVNFSEVACTFLKRPIFSEIMPKNPLHLSEKIPFLNEENLLCLLNIDYSSQWQKRSVGEREEVITHHQHTQFVFWGYDVCLGPILQNGICIFTARYATNSRLSWFINGPKLINP